MKRRCMRVVALIIAISVLLVQVDTVSANAMANAPCVEQGYPQVQSMGFVAEWVAGLGVSAGRLVAFAFVLTLLGFVIENGVSNAWENREEYLSYLTNLKEDFTSWCAKSKEWCSIKASDFDLWLDMIAQGTLDKSSDCWQAIKDYCVDLKTRIDSLSSSTPMGDVVAVSNAEEWIKGHVSAGDILSTQIQARLSYLKGQTSESWISPVNSRYLSVLLSSKAKVVCLKFTDGWDIVSITPTWGIGSAENIYSEMGYCGWSYTWVSNMSDYSEIFRYFDETLDGVPPFCGKSVIYSQSGETFPTNLDGRISVFDLGCSRTVLTKGDISRAQENILLSLATGLVNGYDDWSIEIPKDDGITDEVAQGLTVAGGTSGVIERDGSLDSVDVVGVSGAKDDVIPIDWDKVSVEDLSKPYPYDDIKTVDLVDGVIVGTDTPIDKVVPPIDGSDTSSDRNNYTLTGLTELFPFCIPFDLVMLFQTLKADAVAPCFKWKFVYYVDGEKKTEEIVLDLSKFNKVAEILRMMELLAFMIALTLKTRDLIRG